MKKLLSVLAALAVAVSLSGCQDGQADTVVSETTTTASVTQSLKTTASESTDIVYETLAEGQERDWKIEDVLKNDLEIDGIPISIPCTVEELLNTLGDEYSIDKSAFIYEGDTITSCKYYSGEFISIMLYHNDKATYKLIGAISEEKNIDETTLNVVSLLAGANYGITSLKELPINSSINDCFEKYGQPNEIKIDDEKVYWIYTDSECKLNMLFENNLLINVSGCGFITEEFENK